MEIRFADHSSFQRAAAGMASGALLFGAALHPLTPLAPLAGGILGIAAGAAVVHGRPGWRVAAAGAALVLLLVAPSSSPMLAAVAAIMSLALAVGGPRGIRGLLGVTIGVVTVLIAMWCAQRIAHARETVGWPPLVTTMTAAAAMGLVGVLAMLPRHVQIALDPVRAALNRLPAGLDAEVRDLCARAAAIWSTARDRIADDAGQALVRDGVLKALQVAARSARVDVTGPGEDELARRIADLDQRIAAATDGEVVAQYRAARAALGDQQRHRDRIRQGRERLVARMHNHVAALERFSLHGSPPDTASALRPAVATRRRARDPFDELSHDVAASGEALAELELDDAVPAPAPGASNPTGAA